ncbi:hypothetical protein RF11_14499 [Thelohanellus kitauei]|uniref:Abnormal cell migration protein 18-like fibronectin type I domain-containing protein n=1 Tax=Thelohanellus kitauei TaxID=669202 RepID=A0A0C2NEM9_THEKT|nr:hypothetical protein RF11_14499 [Thelohanellus kitauei]
MFLKIFRKLFIFYENHLVSYGFDNSELYFIFRIVEKGQDNQLTIKCKTIDNGNEIEVIGCTISILSTEISSKSYSIAYKLKLQKYTRFEIEKFTVQFNIDNNEKSFSFIVSNVYIETKCWEKICILENMESITIPISFKAERFSSPCDSDGRSFSFTNKTYPKPIITVKIFINEIKTMLILVALILLFLTITGFLRFLYFYERHITKFDVSSEDSELIIEFKKSETSEDSSFSMKCNTADNETHIEISGCATYSSTTRLTVGESAGEALGKTPLSYINVFEDSRMLVQRLSRRSCELTKIVHQGHI